jgi:meso-butanediol dehydrogenase / (S,S)-butanediol dehydrogenase / diacetyl reductase
VSAYAASKHGILGLNQVWCQELGPHNITVNAVCPGVVESPMWKDHLSPAFAPAFGIDASEVVNALSKQNMPLGRRRHRRILGRQWPILARQTMYQARLW